MNKPPTKTSFVETPLELPITAPFESSGYAVQPDWIDYNGHMNVGYYHVVFDIAAESFINWMGLTADFRQHHDGTTYALESHLHFIREVHEGAPIRFEARLLDFDYKRYHYYMEMFHGEQSYLAASYESVSSWVNQSERKTAPMPDSLIERLTTIKTAHDALPRPDRIGHVISAHPPKK